MGKEFLRSVANRLLPAEARKSERALASAFKEKMTPGKFEVTLVRKVFSMRDLRSDASRVGVNLGNVIKEYVALADSKKEADAITPQEAEMGFTFYYDHLMRQSDGSGVSHEWSAFIKERWETVKKKRLDYEHVVTVAALLFKPRK